MARRSTSRDSHARSVSQRAIRGFVRDLVRLFVRDDEAAAHQRLESGARHRVVDELALAATVARALCAHQLHQDALRRRALRWHQRRQHRIAVARERAGRAAHVVERGGGDHRRSSSRASHSCASANCNRGRPPDSAALATSASTVAADSKR